MPLTVPIPVLVPSLGQENVRSGVNKRSTYSGAVAFNPLAPTPLADIKSLLSVSSTNVDILVNASQIQPSGSDPAHTVYQLLDNGAAVVFLAVGGKEKENAKRSIMGFAEHAVGRVGVIFQSDDLAAGVETALDDIQELLCLSPDDVAALGQIQALPPVWIVNVQTKEALDWARSPAGTAVLQTRSVLFDLSESEATTSAGVELAKLGFSVVVSESKIVSTGDSSQPAVDAASILLAKATTDRPDGLFPTLVTDERGMALGLVYSSPESIRESLRTGTGVYQSRKRGLWYKGASSGDTQILVRLVWDCDSDCLGAVVRQEGRGFCHLAQTSCFGPARGLTKLQQTLRSRKDSAPPGSYTARLFSDPKLLQAKILEEASELGEAVERRDVAFEAADLLYFALARCVAAGVSLEEVEQELDRKSAKISRRTGNAKEKWVQKVEGKSTSETPAHLDAKASNESNLAPTKSQSDQIKMQTFDANKHVKAVINEALQRPSQRSSDTVMSIVKPIVDGVRTRGDAALLEYTHKFEKATSLKSTVIKSPFPDELMKLPSETIEAIDISFENIRKFHSAQADDPKMLTVETMEGVRCHRFARAIESVGLYVPGGTAVLPSTALMLGVPAMVAGCKSIVFATPPRPDGSISPEIVYVAKKVGAAAIVLAGGAQAVAALAYGTEVVPKVDKILGPGNQFVTAAKMLVSNDTSAGVSIDMPAGPSEVLVIADETCTPAFVASDLLSQAEHGPDSQVILIAAGLTEKTISEIEQEVDSQARRLPRVEIVRKSIAHSSILLVNDLDEALELSNQYAPEHLILHFDNAEKALPAIQNAGSVFVGHWTPESVGDYSAGVNHSLPTYGYAKQYSGVSLSSFVKHITASNLTAEGLRNIGRAVMTLAKVEELEAHRRAVEIRLEKMA